MTPSSDPRPLLIRPMTPGDAQTIATWRYPGEYATYDVDELVTADAGYWAVEREDELVGYCCFGAEGRVEGIEEEPGTLDVGYGMRPDLMGHGLGASFVGCIVAFGAGRFSPKRLRLLILQWNARSRTVAEQLGFEHRGTVRNRRGSSW